MSGTAAPLRQLPPGALLMSALSVDEPDGAHATREPIEQPWSSPFPPSLAFIGRAMGGQAGRSAAPPADPRTCDARRHQPAAQSTFKEYARKTTSAPSPTRQSPPLATGGEPGQPISTSTATFYYVLSAYDDDLRYLELIMCQLSRSNVSTPSPRCRPTDRLRRSSSAGFCLDSTRRTPVSPQRASWSRRTRWRVPPRGAR